ncbi:MAG: hypothetical protein R3F19_31940 [Verrucomicrobiales bacterium]
MRDERCREFNPERSSSDLKIVAKLQQLQRCIYQVEQGDPLGALFGIIGLAETTS